MVQINFAKREVQCKLVYYGPSMSGKTANLRQIHDRSPERVRGALTTIATDTERTLFFDFLPLNLGLVANVGAKINIYAVPYIEAQNTLRLLVLEGVDGIVFVADSSPNQLRANMAALENLHENLSQLGRDLRDIPLVFQWNKRDLKNANPIPELANALNPHGKPAFEAAAQMGAGVFQTLKAITHAVLVNVTKMIVVSPTAEQSAPAVETVEEPAQLVAAESAQGTPRTRIRAVASRSRASAGDSNFELPAPSPMFGEPAAEPAPSFEPTRASGSRLRFDDVALPPEEGAEHEPEHEQPAHETPVTPPWRRSPDRPAIRSQQDEFADHLSTDSFSAHAGGHASAHESAHVSAPRKDERSAYATTELPSRDVPRSADRHTGRAVRERRPAETETALEPAAAANVNEWTEYTDPKSVDLQGAAGDWEHPATGSVRVRGPVSGWEETRRTRDARPVVDRRRRGRVTNVETLSTGRLVAGSVFSLALLVVIGYLVYALL